MKNTSLIVATLGIIIVFLSVNFMPATAESLYRQIISPNTVSNAISDTTPPLIKKSQEKTHNDISYNPDTHMYKVSNAYINPIGPITLDMFSSGSIDEVPEAEPVEPSVVFASVLDPVHTFQIILSFSNYSSEFSRPLSAFQWDATTSIYQYTLSTPYSFLDDGMVLGSLTTLEVRFQVGLPYEISYSYSINTAPNSNPGYTQCQVRCSPLGVYNETYQGRIYTSESALENIYDYDAGVIKRSLYYTGDPYDSMVEFHTTNGVFQRGFQYMSCDSDGCGMSINFLYPMPPDYFLIQGGNITKIWINSGWEGTPGDRYSSTQQFTVAPVNTPPQTSTTPVGPKRGTKGTSYTYTTSTIDPNGDNVYYMWDWGDGNITGWLGPYPSGLNVFASHIWSTRGTYQVKVKAKDTLGAESGWSTPLTVNMYKPGDVNNDGMVTFSDIDPFIDAIITTEAQFQTQHPTWAWIAADCNRDGRITFADIDPFVALIGT